MLKLYIKPTNSALLLGRENNACLYTKNKYVLRTPWLQRVHIGSAPKINTYTMLAENHICNNNYIIIFHMITIITDNNVFNYWVH